MTSTPRCPEELGLRQRAALAYFRQFFADNDQLPPVAYTRKHFGWQSQGYTGAIYEALHAKGYIEHNATGKYRFCRTAP